MTLVRDASQPGLWTNPSWKSSQPGMFAVVIGVSQYCHLAGSKDPAPVTYGLGQLAVSALTAFRVFEWLEDEYFVDGCELAKCWVLLAPTAQELAFEPKIAAHTDLPTFDNCELAAGFWFQELQQLPPSAADDSRALFFFSGHGLEAHQEKQILLPHDWLCLPSRNVNRALSTQNLRFGLASTRVPRQFFFIDACRNDHVELRKKRIDGSPVLTEEEQANWQPHLVAPVLYATTSGQQSFQPTDPVQGEAQLGTPLSLFGTALRDGLRGLPNLALRSVNGKLSVDVFPLQTYVKSRVVDLLTKVGATVQQPIRMGGVVDDTIVTYVHAPPSSVKGPPPTGLPPLPLTGLAASQQFEELTTRSTAMSQDVPSTLSTEDWSKDFLVGHRLFGRENITRMWSERVRMFALQDRRPIDGKSLILHRTAWDAKMLRYRVEFSIQDHDGRGFWLQMRDESGLMHGCTLPTDNSVSARYLVEFELDPVSYKLPLLQFDAGLAQDNHQLLRDASLIWRRYQAADPGSAVKEYEACQLHEVLMQKPESPLAATIAALVILRANRLELLHDWLGNLTNWFPAQTDPPVLFAEHLLRTGRPAPQIAKQVMELMDQCTRRGLPDTAEGLAYALAIVDRLLHWTKVLNDAEHHRLERLRDHLHAACSYLRPGGMFTTYSGFAEDVQPWQIVGAVPDESMVTVVDSEMPHVAPCDAGEPLPGGAEDFDTDDAAGNDGPSRRQSSSDEGQAFA